MNLKNTRLEGAVSAASQSYREGLTWIDEKARLEAEPYSAATGTDYQQWCRCHT